MFNPNNFFDAILVIPILNILVGFYRLFQVVALPGALGFSVILLTVVIRLILHPLTEKQLKSTYKLNQLKPELDALQTRYKGDKQKIQQEQLKLYQKAGINPAAGCLPLLIQMPILIALYNLFRNLLINTNLSQVVSEINKVVYLPFLKISKLDLSFFGLNLAHKPDEWQKFGWWLLLVPLITAALQYWQTKMMMPPVQKTEDPSTSLKVNKEGVTEENKKKKEDDMGTAMQKQMSIMMPLMIGYFAYTFPLGLSLYWNTFTVFAIIQQRYLNKKLGKKNEKENTGK